MSSVGLIIPVYNGQEYLTNTFSLLDQYQKNFAGNFLVFFVNDGSTDNTLSQLEEYGQTRTWVSVASLSQNQGKGRAIKMAITKASELAEVIGFTDVDLPYGLDKLAEVVRLVDSGVTVVVGDRTRAESKQYSFYRRLANRAFRYLIPKSLRHIRDTQSGFKFFSAPVATRLFGVVQTSRWVFDLELLLSAVRNEYQIEQLPVELIRQPRGKGGLSLLSNGPQILKDIFKIYKYDRHRAYKIN